MTSSTLDGIKDQLEQERSGIQATADKLSSDLAAINADLARINAAIAALNGQEPASSSGKSSPQRQRKQMSPSAGKAEVIKHIRGVLEKEGTLDHDTLSKRVEEEIVKAGFTRLGYSLRFKEALSTPEFITSQDGVRLRSDKRISAKA